MGHLLHPNSSFLKEKLLTWLMAQRVQSVIAWPHSFGQNIMRAGVHRREKFFDSWQIGSRGKGEDSGLVITSKAWPSGTYFL